MRTTAWMHSDVRKTKEGRFRCEVCGQVMASETAFFSTDCTIKPVEPQAQALSNTEIKAVVA